jgi:hypothetical protein
MHKSNIHLSNFRIELIIIFIKLQMMEILIIFNIIHKLLMLKRLSKLGNFCATSNHNNLAFQSLKNPSIV